MNNTGKSAKTVARFGLLCAVTIVLSYAERLIPLDFTIPGIKLGLANIGVLVALYLYGFRGGAAVSLVRVAVNGMLFTGFTAFIYSTAGAVAALLLMAPLSKSKKLGTAGVSAAGAVAHILGQLSAAWWLLGTPKVFWYAPILLVAACITGVFNGTAAGLVLRYLPDAGQTPTESD